DVTALPYGPSVPHMFIVIFVVMLPVYLATDDPIQAWQAGLACLYRIVGGQVHRQHDDEDDDEHVRDARAVGQRRDVGPVLSLG
ncbi:hypothetical protein C6A85_16835, partial [Mycobacterium sp. ITM-2017-0098]